MKKQAGRIKSELPRDEARAEPSIGPQKKEAPRERAVITIICPNCKTPLPMLAGAYYECPMCHQHGIAPEVGVPQQNPARPGFTDLPGEGG